MLLTFGPYLHAWLFLIGLLNVDLGVAQLFEDDPCTTHDNSNGICKVLQECTILTNLIQQKKMKLSDPKRCGFKGPLETVCCPTNEVMTSTPRPVVDPPYIEKRQTQDTTAKAVDFWESLLTTTAKPDFWLPYISTTTTPTTTTTTTTTPRALVVGNQKLDTNSEFFDLTAILNPEKKQPRFENVIQGVNNQQQLIASERGNRLVGAPDGPQIQEVNQAFIDRNGDSNVLGLNRPNLPIQGANNGFVNGNTDLPGNVGGMGFVNWPGNGHGNRFINGPGNGRGNGFANRPGNGRGNGFGIGHGNGNGFGNGRGNGFGNGRSGQNAGNGFGNGRGNGFGHIRGNRDVLDIGTVNQMGFQNGFVNGANQLQGATGQAQFSLPAHDQFVAQSQYPILQNNAEKPGPLNFQPNNPLIAQNQNLFIPINAENQPVWPTAAEPISTAWNNNNNHVAIYQYDLDTASSNNHESPNWLRDPAPVTHNGPIWHSNNMSQPLRTPLDPVEQVFNNLANNGINIVKAEPYEPHATPPGPVAQSNPFLPNQVASQPVGASNQFRPNQVASQPVGASNPFLPNQARPQPAGASNPFLPQPFNSHADEFVQWPASQIHQSTSKPKPQDPQVLSSKTERPSIAACKIIEQNLTPTLTPHILDGTPVAPGEYPHMAAIGYQNIGNEGAGYDIRCGGTLIHERFVLTAAHCVNSKNDKPAIVRLGISNFDDPDELPHQVEIPVKNVHIHDNYTSAEKYNDIALLEMSQAVQFSNYIAPACLWYNMTDPGEDLKLYVSGWGTVNQKTRSKSRILLKAELILEPLERCNASYVNFGLPRQLSRALEDTQLCARDPGTTKDACQGDSGGPLNVVVDESTKNFYILGVISTGFGCATSVPGLYTRVAAYLDFIESKIWPQP